MAGRWGIGSSSCPVTIAKVSLPSTHNTQHSSDAYRSSILDRYDRLHSRGVLHGDVDPRNWLLDADGSVWLVDFADSTTWNAPMDEQWETLADRERREAAALLGLV
jgi:RIO-like serine/threonine protein kinase